MTSPDRNIPPVVHDAVAFEYILPPINTTRLDNGLPLYWLNAGVQEVVEINWIVPAGLWHEEKQSVANAVAGLLKNGTSKYTSHALHEALEFYGASLKVGAGNDNANITLHALTKHLPQLLPVVYDILTDAIFPEEELNIYRKNTIQRLLVSLRECEFVANQQIDALLFGDSHPYGRYTRRENIEALTRQDLLDFYKKHYDLGGVQIFMAGKIGETECSLINDVFGKTPVTVTVATEKEHTAAPADTRKHSLLNDPNGVQGAIRVARLFPNRHHPDFAPMVVLNTLFGGYFGSRLMSNIREEKGFTYGIYSSLTPYRHGGSITIHTEAGRDVLEAALKEIYYEMDLLRREEVDEEELLLVKNYLLGNLLGDLDGPFSILQRWRTLILNGFTVEHFNRNIAVYKSITPAALKELAIKYYDPEAFFEMVVI